jgi:nucleoside-diphosphate-sugar epimerase
MSQDNCLALSQFNVVIVGNGAIGSALLENLLQRQSLHRAVVLGRSTHNASDDKRVTYVTFDAEDAESVMNAATRVQESMDRVHLLINTVGLLHNQHQGPEKRLKTSTQSIYRRLFR